MSEGTFATEHFKPNQRNIKGTATYKLNSTVGCTLMLAHSKQRWRLCCERISRSNEMSSTTVVYVGHST